MASVESAIRSRVTREYFMPMWPMAMPSHTAMAGNSIGVPPAMRDTGLDGLGDLVEVHVAGDDLVLGTDDADQRAGLLLGRQAQGVQRGSGSGRGQRRLVTLLRTHRNNLRVVKIKIPVFGNRQKTWSQAPALLSAPGTNKVKPRQTGKARPPGCVL